MICTCYLNNWCTYTNIFFSENILIRWVWLIYWLIDWVVGWLIDWLIDWLVDWLIDWLVDWLIDWLVDWLIGLLIDWLIDWFIGRLIDWVSDWLSNCFIVWQILFFNKFYISKFFMLNRTINFIDLDSSCSGAAAGVVACEFAAKLLPLGKKSLEICIT